MSTIRFYCPRGIEPWDWRSIDEGGIGGSETHVVEMAARLAKEHDVAVYAPLKEDTPESNAGVSWRNIHELDPREDAIWVLQRCPEALEKYEWKGKKVLHLHDIMIPNAWDPDWGKQADLIVGQSETHARAMQETLPGLNGQVTWVGSGARVGLFERIEAEGPVERNPKKMIWASDPLRGLGGALLPMWEALKRAVPDAELHIFYGWQVTDGLMKDGDELRTMQLEEMKSDTLMQLDQPGIYWHGRVGQEELYREWLSAGVWPYWTDFQEVCCIAALEAQCAGVIPVTNSWWALAENVHYGWLLHGHPTANVAVQDEYLEATVFVLNNPEVQELFRQEMVSKVRERFSWDAVAARWEAAILA